MKPLLLAIPALALVLLAVYLPQKGQLSKQQQIVDEINSAKISWTAKVYPEEQHFPLGKLDGGQHLNAEYGFSLKSFTPEQIKAAPDSFDSRDQWPNCESIKEIRNQSRCGSCWAFSSATVFSDRLCIGSGQKIQTRLSPEDVLSCCFSCGNGCDGGFPNGAWFYFINNGIVSGNGWGDNKWCKSYTISPDNQNPETPACRRVCPSNPSTNYYLNVTKAANGYLLVGEEAFKAEISSNGPVVASFTVYDDFMHYKDGVYWHKTGGVAGGHAIRVVGYGVDNGVKYWTIANSWSPTWGEKGYFRIRRGVNECGIEAEGIAGLVIV